MASTPSVVDTDPEAEVRKLQDLVRKLELQNQMLRNKHRPLEENDVGGSTNVRKYISLRDHDSEANINAAGTFTDPGNDSENIPPENFLISNPNIAKAKARLRYSSLEDVTLVDVDRLQDGEDDTWLYKSPIKLSAAQKNISPYNWVRKDFEAPSPEVGVSKKSLLYKLEEVTRVSRSASMGALSTLFATPLSVASDSIAISAASNVPDKPSMPAGTNQVPTMKQSLLGIYPNAAIRQKKADVSSDISTGKLSSAPAPLRANETISSNIGNNKVSSVSVPDLNKDSSIVSKEESSSIGVSAAATTLMTATATESSLGGDVIGIHLLARMQEENLRQSFSAAPRKAMSRSLNKVLFTDSTSDAHILNSSSPGRFLESSARSKMSKDSLISVGSASSINNSPPGTPYDTQAESESSKYRSSMPNLTTGALSIPDDPATEHRPVLTGKKRLASTSITPGNVSHPASLEQRQMSITGKQQATSLGNIYASSNIVANRASDQQHSSTLKKALPEQRRSTSNSSPSLSLLKTSMASTMQPRQQLASTPRATMAEATPRSKTASIAAQSAGRQSLSLRSNAVAPTQQQRSRVASRSSPPKQLPSPVKQQQFLTPVKQQLLPGAVSPTRSSSYAQQQSGAGRKVSPLRGVVGNAAQAPRSSLKQPLLLNTSSRLQKTHSGAVTNSGKPSIPPKPSGVSAASGNGVTTSKLPTFNRRSGIPSPQRMSTPRTNDESWKEGCF